MFGEKRGNNGKRPGPPAHDDLVQRDFTAASPNTLWFTDLTMIRTNQGWLYAAVVLDAFNREVVSYAVADRETPLTAMTALDQAIRGRRPPRGCIIHSDRGYQFTSHDWLGRTRKAGLVPSIGARKSALDNAAMESSFSLLQNNVLNRRRGATREQLRLAVLTWIEKTYHPPPAPRSPRPAHPNRARDPPTSRSRGLTIPTQ